MSVTKSAACRHTVFCTFAAMPLSKNNITIYLYALGAMLFWGFSFVWTKIVLDYMNPVSIIFFRLIVSSFLLYGFISLFKRKQPIHRHDIKWFFLSALFEPFLYFIGENYGVKFSTATISSVMIALIPVLTPLAAFVFLKEKIRWLNILGIIVSFAGVLLMVTGKGLEFETDPRGLLFLMTAVLAGLFSSVLMGRLARTYSSLTIITYQNIIGAIYFIPVFMTMEAGNIGHINITTELVFSLIMLAVFASSFAFIFYVNAIRGLGITRTNIFTNLIPIITAVVSFFLLDEQFNASKIIGMAVVIGGVFMAQIKMHHIRGIWRKIPKS
ncbi:MAG: DMT family transporter [Bacteroidales bacterium]|nr:DMT family transporter [Bacteroidales bacterium]